MIRPTELEGKTRDELVSIANHLGKKVHHKLGEEKIKDLILQASKPVKEMKHPAEKGQAPVFDNTEEEVRELIALYMKEGFEVEFPGDNTWIFRYKGCEESGNMSIPPRVIRMKAEFVAKGKRVLMSRGRDANDPTYAGIVIAA